MIIMAEPNPITADGMFGIFLGHTFIVTENGHEVVDKFPLGDRGGLTLDSVIASAPSEAIPLHLRMRTRRRLLARLRAPRNDAAIYAARSTPHRLSLVGLRSPHPYWA